MTGQLDGRRTIVTGAASGIGRAVARRFAAEGARVGLLDRDAAGLGRVASEIVRAGGVAVAREADQAQEPPVERAVAELTESLGGLDTLVCVAGIELAGSGDGRVHELDAAAWYRMIAVNLTGTFHVCKHGVSQIMRHSPRGSVILTGSPCGLYGFAPAEHAYSASKAGVHGLMRAMSAGYAADGIRVNAVIPGYVATPLTAAFAADAEAEAAFCRTIPMGRPGTPEEIAGLYVWLASDEASYATGGFYHADGGHTAV